MLTGEAYIGSGVGIPITPRVRPEGDTTRTWPEVVLSSVFVSARLRIGTGETVKLQLYERARSETVDVELIPLGRGGVSSRFEAHTSRAGGQEVGSEGSSVWTEHRIGFEWRVEEAGYAYREGVRSDKEARRELYVMVAVGAEKNNFVVERVDIVVWWRRRDTMKQIE